MRRLETLVTDYVQSSRLVEWDAERFISKGSGLRGELLIRLCHELGADLEVALNAAVAVELIHNASLVHDDIMDRDLERRGRPTAYAMLGEHQAILLGDVLIAEAYNVIAGLPVDAETKVNLIRIMSQSIAEASAGQGAQISCSANTACTLEACLDWSRLKTGSLFALPVKVALGFNKNDQFLEQSAEAAIELGLAYQIKDDLSDWLGCKIGRNGLSDTKNDQWTFARIAERDAPGNEISFLLDLIKNAECRYRTIAEELPLFVRKVLKLIASRLLVIPGSVDFPDAQVVSESAK
ncbi:MAG: polyprenyl synthetase family protein [Verrucomicrobiota bacterium]